jgi:hypothetical protein
MFFAAWLDRVGPLQRLKVQRHIEEWKEFLASFGHGKPTKEVFWGNL